MASKADPSVCSKKLAERTLQQLGELANLECMFTSCSHFIRLSIFELSTKMVIFGPSQNWEEEEEGETMEEDKEEQADDEEDPDSRTDSKANGEEEMEHGNESEEE